MTTIPAWSEWAENILLRLTVALLAFIYSPDSERSITSSGLYQQFC
ncbi:MAG: hypothetical protein WAM39_17130 [Bryobacteraceae bacterium]